MRGSAIPLFSRASQDNVTGLLDRETFYARADRAARHAPPGTYSVICLRVDNMGTYNIRSGIAAGEEVLRVIGARIEKAFPKGFAARYSVDTFLVLGMAEGVVELVDDINALLPTFGLHEGLSVKAGYIVQRSDVDAREGVEMARFAVQSIRYTPGVYCCQFAGAVEAAYRRRVYVGEHIDDAIAQGEIRAFAQPIVRLLTGHVCEVEILARWESAEYGMLQPFEFVVELERRQLVHKLDGEVVRLACKQWREAADLNINVPFGINLSRLDFELCDMYSVVREAMERYRVPVSQVHIEITESALSHDVEALVAGIRRFREEGFEIYLDDFGSGYSSLHVLAGGDFDVIKLDMSLIRDVESNERSRVIVADTVSMAKRLGLQTLCEGIENEEQLSFLHSVGCEKGQGYYFGRPMDHESVMERLRSEALVTESADVADFLDAVGQVNLIDGTSAGMQGVEAASFLGTEPIGVIEVMGEGVKLMASNFAFNWFVSEAGTHSFDRLLDSSDAGSGALRRKIRYMASKSKETGQAQALDFIANGNACAFVVSHVFEGNDRDAYLVRASNISKVSTVKGTDVLERSLRFLYSIYKRIDLFDLDADSARNVYLNAPLYSVADETTTATETIARFADEMVHPDDRERFLGYYDLDRIRHRMGVGSTDHVSFVARVRSESGRYTEQVLTIIPMIVSGRSQCLSCLRDRYELEERGVSGDERITDSALLTAVLDAADRMVFWKDAERRFLGANQAFLDFFGFEDVDEVLGRTDEDMGWHVQNEPFKNDELRVLAGESIHNAPGQCASKGVLHDIEASKRPLYANGHVAGLVGYFSDLGIAKAPRVVRRGDTSI